MILKRTKRIIFGNCASGKTHKIEGLVLKSLCSGRKVLVFCRTRESESLTLKAMQSVKGLSSDGIFNQCLEPGTAVRPDNTLDPAIFDSARLVILGMEPYGEPYSEVRGDLAANILRLIADTDNAYIDEFDIYLDDAQLWGGDAITALPGEATLSCQSLSQLDELMGEERSDQLVERSRECEFFRCADKRTVDKVVDLSNFEIGLDIMSLGIGESFLIGRTVLKEGNEKLQSSQGDGKTLLGRLRDKCGLE